MELNNFFRFTVDSDNSHKSSTLAGARHTVSDEVWYQLSQDPMIRLNINNQEGPSAVPVTFNVDMTLPIADGIFTPGTDFVDVAGTVNAWEGSDHMTDDDGDGK